MNQDPHRYDDMLKMEHPVSKKHPQMSLLNRAAQFSPFSALTGFSGQILSAEHRRCNRILLSDEEKEQISSVLTELKKHDLVSVTYFMDDPGTDGAGGTAEGEYVEAHGEIQNLLPTSHTLRIGGKDWWTDIHFDDIIAIRRNP